VAAGAFLVEGPHATAGALASGHTVRELFVTAAAADRETDLLRRAAGADVRVTLVTDAVLAVLAETVTPQGVVAVVAGGTTTLRAVLDRRPRLLVALVGASDPGNAGTVIRTADAAGADAVLLTGGSVDPFTGKCVRASAGSIFHLPVVADLALEDVLGDARDAGLQLLATTLDGTPVDAMGERLTRPIVWLFGNEAHGLPPVAVDAADEAVRVPIHGRAESLNLAAAAAVCLYASAAAQRR
jgi:TrmH family RNA methyltransferase